MVWSGTSASPRPALVSKPIVVTYSVVLLAASFVFSFLVFLIDAQRTSGSTARQVSENIQHAPDKLNKEFDELQGAQPEPAEAPTQVDVAASGGAAAADNAEAGQAKT